VAAQRRPPAEDLQERTGRCSRPVEEISPTAIGTAASMFAPAQTVLKSKDRVRAPKIARPSTA